MKINGKQLNVREIRTVKFERLDKEKSFELKVCGYPIGINKAYENLNPRPQAPKKPTGVTKVGTGPEMKTDYSDPEYLAKMEDWLFLQKFHVIYNCLSVDSTISFESDDKTIDNLRKIPIEMASAGFSEGDIGKLLEEIKAATNIEPEAITEARANFA